MMAAPPRNKLATQYNNATNESGQSSNGSSIVDHAVTKIAKARFCQSFTNFGLESIRLELI